MAGALSFAVLVAVGTSFLEQVGSATTVKTGGETKVVESPTLATTKKLIALEVSGLWSVLHPELH